MIEAVDRKVSVYPQNHDENSLVESNLFLGEVAMYLEFKEPSESDRMWPGALWIKILHGEEIGWALRECFKRHNPARG